MSKRKFRSKAPQHSVGRGAVLERDDVSYFMANVHIHFIGHTQGEIYYALPVEMSAHHRPVPVLHRQTELCTPLWDLQEEYGGHTQSQSQLTGEHLAHMDGLVWFTEQELHGAFKSNDFWEQ